MSRRRSLAPVFTPLVTNVACKERAAQASDTTTRPPAHELDAAIKEVMRYDLDAGGDLTVDRVTQQRHVERRGRRLRVSNTEPDRPELAGPLGHFVAAH